MQGVQTVQQPLPQAMQWQTVAPPVVPTETQTSAEPRRGFPARRSTGFIQAILGLALLICGIVVIAVDFPEVNYDTRSYNRNTVEGIDRRDKQAWCIWIGVAVIFNSVCGIFSKKNQTLISLYMAFSITVCVISGIGLIPVSISLGKSNRIRAVLQDDSGSSYDDPCKPYRYGSSYYTTPKNLSQLERECIKDTLSAARLHLAMHCIMLTCLLAEFVVAIIGASSTCSGLDCCNSTPRQHMMYYQTQVPQFQSPSPFIVQNGPPPPYPGQLAPYPVIQTTGHALPSGGLPQQVVVPPVSQPPPAYQPSPVSQPPPVYQPPLASQQPPPVSQPPSSGMYLTPDVREGATAPVQADDDSTYLQPNATYERAIHSPGNQQEYSYADPQYRPAPPPDDPSNNRADNEDDSYVTINN
ncbi:uncharacterized protein [Apostichopus japonicus]|uniref:uncharacterized protein isoform X1 n=1 Tax=Stichopus japonicus TaxID=307972 RepID=UPI003AB80284